MTSSAETVSRMNSAQRTIFWTHWAANYTEQFAKLMHSYMRNPNASVEQSHVTGHWLFTSPCGSEFVFYSSLIKERASLSTVADLMNRAVADIAEQCTHVEHRFALSA